MLTMMTEISVNGTGAFNKARNALELVVRSGATCTVKI